MKKNDVRIIIQWKGFPINAWSYQMYDLSQCKPFEKGELKEVGSADTLDSCLKLILKYIDETL